MIALGIEAHITVATNMLALTFMSVGGSLPFVGKGVLSRSRLLPAVGSRSLVLAWVHFYCSMSRSRLSKSQSLLR
jgi:hypothetical protein